MADRTFTLKFIGDVKQLSNSVNQMETQTKTFGQKARSMGSAVVTGLAAAAVVDFGRTAVESASNAEQAFGAARSTFGAYTSEIEKFSESTAKNLGISQQDFLQIAATTGSLMKNAGVPLDEVTKSTEALTARAADLAATFGGTVPEAMEAINSALKGEMDPLERFGVSLKASTVDAKAQAMGLVDAEGKTTAYGKAMAAQALIMEQSADKAGTFTREQGTLAGQTATMKAQFEDLTATLGTALLPILVELGNVLKPILEFVAENADWLGPLAIGITAVVVAVKAWTIAQAALNIVMLASPVGLIIAAIAAIGAAIVLLVKNWDTVVEALKNAGEWLIDLFKKVPEALRYIFGLVFDIVTWPYRQAWEAVKYIAGLFLNVFEYPVKMIKNLFGGLADALTYPFRIAFEGIKWLWNSTVGGFGFEIPSWIPLVGGKSFRIPKLAAGGIITRPTLVMAGEAGREAIVPLDRDGSGIGTTIINVYTLNATYETGLVIRDALAEVNRVGA